MTTYALNEAHNGIEITFDGKPSEAIRTALKSNGYRWHKQKKLWYAKQTAERLALAESLAEGRTEAEPRQTPQPAERWTTAHIEELMSHYPKTDDGQGWTGCNRVRAYGQELKKLILDELKSKGIKATAKTGRGGWTTSFTFSVVIPTECKDDPEPFKNLVRMVVDSFNYDHSDIMTDYFDCGFYDWYEWK